MNEGRCATCKWWKPQEYWTDAPLDPYWNICVLTVSKDDAPLHGASDAIAYDRDDYFAALRTFHEFGCTQYEARDDEA